MKIAVRAYSAGHKIFEELLDVEEVTLDEMVKAHIKRIVPYERHMIEIEFIAEQDNPARFFRFGTDPDAMVMPVEIKL